MSIVMQVNPFEFFVDAAGTPLDSGYIWVGQPNKYSPSFPVVAYYDEAMTIPAAMPLRTSNGYIVRNGSPAFLYINGNYSILVQDRNHRQMYYVPDFLLIGNDSAVPAGDLSNSTDPTKGAGQVGRATRQIHTITELRTVAGRYDGDCVQVTSYYDGWAATLIGPKGGGRFVYDAADSTTVDNGGSVIVTSGEHRWKRVNSTTATSSQWGAKGDGVTDDYPSLAAALAWLQVVAAGGGSGSLEIEPSFAPYCISDSLQIGVNTHLICNEWLKITADTTYDCAVVGIPGATDWRVSGLKVNCNSIPAQGGFYLRRNNVGCDIDSVEVINAVHSKTTKGGRAVTVEAGSNPALYGSRRSTIGNIIARDCYNAVTVQGGVDTESSNFIINNVVAENCETVVLLFGNTTGYPHAGDKMQGIISNVAFRNCGKSTTYARPHGIISSDRGSNILIGNVSGINDAAYGSVGAMVHGDFHNCHVNMIYEGDCTRLATFSRFAEVDIITDDLFTTSNSTFNLTSEGSCTDVAIAANADGLHVVDTTINAVVDTVTSGNTMASSMATMTRAFMSIWSKSSNARMRGFCSHMGVKTIATYAGLDQSFSDFLTGGATYDPPSLAPGASSIEQTTPVTGAAIGDFVDSSFSLDTLGIEIVARVSAADTVKWYMHNPDGNPNGTQNLNNGTVRFRVRKR